MPSTTIKLINQKGLHARAAAKLAGAAERFECRIRARRADTDGWVDGKSVMSLMLLAAACGSELELEADGCDADRALESICALINDRFDEDE